LVDLSLSLPAPSRHPKFAWLSGEAGGIPPFRLRPPPISFRYTEQGFAHARTDAV
jgi:hypothetical protein